VDGKLRRRARRGASRAARPARARGRQRLHDRHARSDRGLREFDRLGDDFVVFVEPPSFDERIVNQYALFSLMSSADASLDEWVAERTELVRRIVIPAELKWEVRDKLDQSNINERVLFPGLDGLSRWVARYFAPRRQRSEASQQSSL
jgi:hypothetical protein